MDLSKLCKIADSDDFDSESFEVVPDGSQDINVEEPLMDDIEDVSDSIESDPICLWCGKSVDELSDDQLDDLEYFIETGQVWVDNDGIIQPDMDDERLQDEIDSIQLADYESQYSWS